MPPAITRSTSRFAAAGDLIIAKSKGVVYLGKWH